MYKWLFKKRESVFQQNSLHCQSDPAQNKRAGSLRMPDLGIDTKEYVQLSESSSKKTDVETYVNMYITLHILNIQKTWKREQNIR